MRIPLIPPSPAACRSASRDKQDHRKINGQIDCGEHELRRRSDRGVTHDIGQGNSCAPVFTRYDLGRDGKQEGLQCKTGAFECVETRQCHVDVLHQYRRDFT